MFFSAILAPLSPDPGGWFTQRTWKDLRDKWRDLQEVEELEEPY